MAKHRRNAETIKNDLIRFIGMITNYEILQEFEDSLLRNNNAEYMEKLKIFEQLMRQAKFFNVWHPEQYDESIKNDIEIARVLNWEI